MMAYTPNRRPSDSQQRADAQAMLMREIGRLQSLGLRPTINDAVNSLQRQQMLRPRPQY
jgi:hypothetical protein